MTVQRWLMFFNPESMKTGIIVTAMMAVMVFFLPLLDRMICRRYGLSLSDGISTNPDADRLLRRRKILLVIMFIFYLLTVVYVTFLSRGTADDYRVHAGPLLHDFTSSFYIDFGLLDAWNILVTEGFSSMLKHIHVISGGGIAQVYMNVAMFVPMGYLLPYIFDWFRRDVFRRTVPFCFLASVLIENVQLLSRHGYYDLDDLLTNTLGGMIGALLFVAVAYTNTHPNWRKEFRARRKWKKTAKKAAVYPFLGRIHMMRTTIYTCDEESTRHFFSDQLGFFLYNEHQEGNSTHLLYECNRTQIEVIVLPKGTPLPPQQITIAANNSEKIRKKLIEEEIEVSEYSLDPYTGLRTFSVSNEEGIRITFMEE